MLFVGGATLENIGIIKSDHVTRACKARKKKMTATPSVHADGASGAMMEGHRGLIINNREAFGSCHLSDGAL